MSRNFRPHIAHLGIFVWDLPRLEQFYTELFGMVVTDRGVGAVFKNDLVFLSGAPDQHHQIVLSAGRAPGCPSTVMQISVKVEGAEELRELKAKAEALGVTELIGLNHGNAWSVYFDDPEGNRIEVYADTPFHTPQPCAARLNLDQSDAELLAETEAIVGRLPGSMSREAYIQLMTERLS